jgi:hypothetical protein
LINSKGSSTRLLRALLVAILWLISLIVLLDLLNTSLDFGRCIGDLLIYLLLDFVTGFKLRWARNRLYDILALIKVVTLSV